MGRMGELAITIEEMLANGMTPEAISTRLCIPIEWVLDVEASLVDVVGYAEASADADAIAYGESL